jgi:hypothetical protein
VSAGGGLAGEDLRALVREVLRESLDALPAADPTGARPAPQSVQLGTNADLDGFVRRLADLCEDPGARGDLREGRLRFRLAPTAHSAADVAPGPPAAAVQRVERGALTERHVRDAARSGARLVAAAGTVITPLARDRARAMGVEIHKEG